ncbi:sigma-70 family RNA polymerase sigma factor [Streptomyces sp. G2]|nr:sigma-70 family RNA polymerase sigma factor [Streptomyces sp. G2]
MLLRGGVDRVGVEPTAEELAALPPDDVRRRARDCLIAHNQGLVHSLARKHLEQGLEYEDLFQHGVIGLLNAVRKYDALQGNKLSTYATWWIRQAMSRAVADEGSAIRVPVHMHEAMQKVARAERQLISSGRHPSLADVAVACDLPLEKVRQVRRVSKVTDSLDRVIGDGTSLGELVEGRTAIPSVEGTVLQHLADEDVHRLVALLPERYAFIVDRRVGLSGQDPATLDVIGAELKVTRERVRQLESHALPVLRLALEAPDEEPYTALRAMLTDPRVGSNPVGAISRDLKGAKWGAGVVALRAFRARTGHAYPAPDHHEDGFPLGVWMTEQRALAGADGTGLAYHRKLVLGLAGVRWHPVAEAEPEAPRRPRPIPGLVRPRPAVPAQRAATPEPAPVPTAAAPRPPVPPAPAAEPEPLEPVAEPETVAQVVEPETVTPVEPIALLETADGVTEEPEAPASGEEPVAAEEPEASQLVEETGALVAGRPTEERLREAEEALRALESEVVHRVAVARADERNKARAAIEAEVSRRTAETLEAADRLLEEAQEEAEERLRAALESAGARAREEADTRLRAALREAEIRFRAPLEAAEARAREAQEEIVRLHEAVSRTAKRYEDRLRENGAPARIAELEQALQQARAEVQRLTADAQRESGAAERRIAELDGALRLARADAERESRAAELRTAELGEALHRARAEIERLAAEGPVDGGAAGQRIAELEGALDRARADAARESGVAARRVAESEGGLHRARAEARAAEDAAAERMRGVEMWAERVVAEARARVTEVEARLDAALAPPAPPAPPAGPDPRKWWQR